MTEAITSRLHAIQNKLATDLLGALADAERLAAEHPDHFDARMMHAYIRLRARDFEGAEAALLDIDAAFANKSAVKFNLAICCERQGRLPDALRYFGEARHLSGSEELPAVLAARCMHRLGRPDAAISVLNAIVERSPSHAGARFWLMQALLETGTSTTALRHANLLRSTLKRDQRSLLSVLALCQENDFAGWTRVDDKAGFDTTVSDYRRQRGTHAYAAWPDTFIMPDGMSALEQAHASRPDAWLVKPARLHNGHGIRIITSPADAPTQPGWIVQRYIAKPALVHERKFSLRIFLLITAVAPVRVYLFHGGRTVFSVQPFVAGDYRSASLPMHIAHTSVFGSQVDAAFEETKRLLEHPNAEWPYSRLARYLGAAGMDVEALWGQLRQLASETVDLLDSSGLFEAQAAPTSRFAYVPKIVGLDILIDSEGKPWLTEIESGPTMNGLFDGGLEQDRTFAQVVDLMTHLEQEPDSAGRRATEPAHYNAGTFERL